MLQPQRDVLEPRTDARITFLPGIPVVRAALKDSVIRFASVSGEDIDGRA